MSYKIKRIQTEMQRYLNNIILTEVKDEIIKKITITDIEVNNDISLAKIYFTSLEDIEKKELEKHLNESTKFLRTRLANLMDLRHTPDLKFIYDESVEYGTNIEKILK
jgi:ribosome-binding factor A